MMILTIKNIRNEAIKLKIGMGCAEFTHGEIMLGTSNLLDVQLSMNRESVEISGIEAGAENERN